MTLLFFAAQSREIYNHKPEEISPGIIAIDTLPAHFSDCSYHLRVEIPPRADSPKWGTTLHYSDSTFSVIELKRPGASVNDSDYGLPLDVTLIKYAADSSVIASEKFNVIKNVDPTMSAWSLTLTLLPDERDMICSVGQSKALLSFPVEAAGLETITAFTGSNLRLSRLSLFSTGTDDLTALSVASAEELAERIKKSTESVEGYWRYLDRDTDPRKLNIAAANYRLATLIAPDATIEIIYLGGISPGDKVWKPLMLKGRLVPTVFMNHYDLVWYDAFGAKIDIETSADLIDGAILKLNFPLQGGTIRFQKDLSVAR